MWFCNAVPYIHSLQTFIHKTNVKKVFDEDINCEKIQMYPW